MTVRFRVAGPEDVPAVLALLREDHLGAERETAPDALYQMMFSRIDREAHVRLVVGQLEGEIVACYQLTALDGLSHKAIRRGQIEDVRVAERLRGQGIGHQMMADAEARARDMGCGLLQLVAHHTREDTHRFYMSNGFTPSHVGFKRILSSAGDQE
ncbi:GNAT family N-acetyltransferase [Fontisubflavum oceani]|uniref:GNAT family N-acetyltransferase n=1 Tax=Fontisubflavum oceani TaxID=2978973 RepID=UPI0025B316CB|nr:GNAT family N-acetyltransferase [Fontisubflavum oceani]WJY23018.1 GNAT family N-acetyltransferase [Fontisubflavum oceani]